MTLTNRQRGDAFERQTRNALTQYGWLVIRAGGSLGIADLVALRLGSKPLLVSCKLSGRIDPGEREALHDAARSAGASPYVASRPKPGHVLFRVVQRDSATAPTRLVDVDTVRATTSRRKVADDATETGDLAGTV